MSLTVKTTDMTKREFETCKRAAAHPEKGAAG